MSSLARTQPTQRARRARRQRVWHVVVLLLLILLTHVATVEVFMIVDTPYHWRVGCDPEPLPWSLGAIPPVAQFMDDYCNA